MHASFHERVWDLQQRKAGAQRLENRLEWERIGEKLQLNSFYGKISQRCIDDRSFEREFEAVYNRRRAKRFELDKLAREFRPF